MKMNFHKTKYHPKQRWSTRNVYIHCALNFLFKYSIRIILVMIFFTLLWMSCSDVKKVSPTTSLPSSNRSFVVDWEHDRFLKDGRPFRFIAGSFHYFRAHPDSWQRILRTMRAAGLNAVTTYVEWSLHNPRDGVYVWNGIADLEKFIRLAVAEDLLVILRPGPYICAERDMGGFPYWLLSKYPNIQLRTADNNYLSEVRIWYLMLFARIGQYLYGNGGPIIMVQVENEYGSYLACDNHYLDWLRNETELHVKNNAVLFTNDGPKVVRCGHIKGVLATMDFGGTAELPMTWWILRNVQPKGPFVNIEFYSGWLTHWGEKTASVPLDTINTTLIKILKDGASLNFYMFFGGTNFGFTAGANNGGPGLYQPDITSYDYDAPLTEAGDTTPKYFGLRDIIGKYEPLPNIPVPKPARKANYGIIRLLSCCTLLSDKGRRTLSTGTLSSKQPKTFEALNQYSGLVLYETILHTIKSGPSILIANGLRDRGYVFVDNELVGILSRQTPIYRLPISARLGQKLQILVENQGRINYNELHDFKGLTSKVLLDNQVLSDWTMTKFPLESYEDIQKLIQLSENTANGTYRDLGKFSILRSGPVIFYGVLNIEMRKDIAHTYLDMTGWGKGVAFINGENLGRYWPLTGPQISLYVPSPILKQGINQIVIIEYQNVSIFNQVSFVDKPIFV